MEKFMINKLMSICLVMFLAGCASTSYWAKSHEENLKKAKSGDSSAMLKTAQDYCYGVLKGALGLSISTLDARSNQQCVYWWNEIANTNPDLKTSFKGIAYEAFWNAHWPGSEYSAGGTSEFKKMWDDAEFKISTGLNPNLTDALIFTYAHFKDHSNLKYISNSDIKSKIISLSAQRCDKDNDQAYCDLNARSEYFHGDRQIAMTRYKKSPTGDYNWRHEGLLLAQLYQPNIVPEALMDINLLDLYQSVETSMAWACKQKSYDGSWDRHTYNGVYSINGGAGGLSLGECKTFNRRNLAHMKKRAEFLTMYRTDEGLSLDVKQDKYKVGATTAYKEKNFYESTLYFELLEKTGYELPVNMIYYRANALRDAGYAKEAKASYIEYVNKAGKGATYYRDSLNQMNELSQ